MEHENDEPDRLLNARLNIEVDTLELPVRTVYCLGESNLRFLGEVVRMTEAETLALKDFGRKSRREMKEILGELGLRFGMDVGEWSPP